MAGSAKGEGGAAGGENADSLRASTRRVHNTFPCDTEKKASFNCLDQNGYNRDTCKEFFDAYKACKRNWSEQKRKAREAQFRAERPAWMQKVRDTVGLDRGKADAATDAQAPGTATPGK